MRIRSFALWLTTLAVLAPRLSAHDGPPYPVCVDEAMGPVSLSIWADPDVGIGTFYYYVDPPTDGVRVQAVAQFLGLDGAIPEAMEGASEVRGVSQVPEDPAGYQQIGTLPFEQRGDWKVTFQVQNGENPLGQIALDIKVTPPGLGRLYLLWYAIPFFAAAAIWLRIFLASRAHLAEVPPAQESDDPFPDANASGPPRS